MYNLKKAKACAVGGMFISLLVLPRLLFIPLKPYVDTENYENRAYEEKPKLTFSGLKDFPEHYDAYFNDYLPFKNPLTALGKRLDIAVFGEVTSDSVLMGKEGWMFYRLANDREDSLADYQGTNCYSPEELAGFYTLLKGARERLEAQGTELVLYIVPNKEQVCSEYMPDTVPVVNPHSKAQLLYEYLRDRGEKRIYYPLEEFKWAKDNWCQVYRKYDTHWNDMGAYMASRMIIQDIDSGGADATFHKDIYLNSDIEDRGTFDGDLAVMLSLQRYYKDDAFLKVRDYRPEISISLDSQNERETLTRYSSDVKDDDRKVLLLRDSFGVHMAEYFAKNYPSLVLADYRTEDAGALAGEEKPDVIVIEVAERYTDYMFDVLEKLGE